jgi:hypothetical protein
MIGSILDLTDNSQPGSISPVRQGARQKSSFNPLTINDNFTEEDFEEWGRNGGVKPDGLAKNFDTHFPATSLRDDAHRSPKSHALGCW